MRLVLVAVVALCAAPSWAQEDPRKPLSALNVYHDGKGHYLAVAPGVRGTKTSEFGKPVLYYGSKSQMRRMTGRVPFEKSELRKGSLFHVAFSDPFHASAAPGTTDYWQWASLMPGDRMVVRCGKHDATYVRADAKTQARVRRAKVAAAPLRRVPEVLGRDDDGLYYYVDRHDDQMRRFDRHLYIGRRGRMKRVRLKDVINDASGMLLVGRAGERLKVKFDPRAGTTKIRWRRKGKAEVPLISVDPVLAVTRAFIYAELGVYLGVKGGTPCDFI